MAKSIAETIIEEFSTGCADGLPARKVIEKLSARHGRSMENIVLILRRSGVYNPAWQGSAFWAKFAAAVAVVTLGFWIASLDNRQEPASTENTNIADKQNAIESSKPSYNACSGIERLSREQVKYQCEQETSYASDMDKVFAMSGCLSRKENEQKECHGSGAY